MMNIKDIKRQRHELLESVAEELADQMIPARMTPINDGDQSELPEMLVALFEDLAVDGAEVLGEFFFAPSDEEDEVQIFQSVLTLQEDISEEMVGELLQAASFVNSFIPVGAFSLNAAQTALIYRHGYEMPIPVSDEEIKNAVDLSMGVATQMVQRYGYLMVEVADGDRDAQSVLGAALPADESEADDGDSI